MRKKYKTILFLILFLSYVFLDLNSINYSNDIVEVQYCDIEIKDEKIRVGVGDLINQDFTPSVIALEEVVTAEPIIEVEQPTYTEEEYETFAHLLYAEAGGESDKCIYYVGSVVINRIKSENYPNTLLEVIYQKGQYSPTWHGFMNREVSNPNCYTIAKYLLENDSILPSYVTHQSSLSICETYNGTVYEMVDGECFWY